MKKLFVTLIFLFFIYFSLQALFYFFGPGHITNYVINNFKIKEEYTNMQKKENQSYNFTITDDNSTFYLQIFENFDNKEKIIEDIKSYRNNDFTCIMPIFLQNKVLTDLICIKDNIIYNYADLVNANPEIDNFYNSLDKFIAKENLESQDYNSNVILYKNNMQPNYYLSLVTYKGFLYANPTNKLLYAINIYENDAYDNYLSKYINEYYVTVNYDEQYGYSKIYIYNITNGNEEIVTLRNNIEKNSYIQGIYKDSLYIFDRSNKKQYEINTKTKNVLEVGNVSTGVKIYRNGAFERVSAYECANKDILFKEEVNNSSEYKYLGSTLGTKTGYSYYYKIDGAYYRIYRVNNSHKEAYTYLFKTQNIDKILIINEYIYFLDNNYLKYYSDYTGIRTLAYNSEISFNKNLEYQIIYQK